jgi:hypothetical protein
VTHSRVIGSLAAVVIAALALVGCSDDDSTGSGPTTDDAAQVEATPTSTAAPDACAVLDADQASAVAGVPMVRDTEPPADPLASTCKYVSAEPDAETGGILHQLRVDVYEGSQFFDLEGNGYPSDEREPLTIGDESFVHVGNEERGVTVQIGIGEVVYSVNYTQRAILTDQAPAAAGRSDALVVALEAEFSG